MAWCIVPALMLLWLFLKQGRFNPHMIFAVQLYGYAAIAEPV